MERTVMVPVMSALNTLENYPDGRFDEDDYPWDLIPKLKLTQVRASSSYSCHTRLTSY